MSIINPNESNPVKVLVVDDSRTSRELLATLLTEDPRFEVVGVAASGEEALARFEDLSPQLITMDIHMPGMGGVEAVKAILARSPRPIVVVSDSIKSHESFSAVQALAAGALEAVGRPNLMDARGIKQLLNTLHLMSQVRMASRGKKVGTSPLQHIKEPPRLIAIGASTGGPSLIRDILLPLPADFSVPIVVSQHMAEGFIKTFVEWLSMELKLPVHHVVHGKSVFAPGVHVCPDVYHTRIFPGGLAIVDTTTRDKMNEASIDSLFESVATAVGSKAVGFLLTGMGRDGAAGLLQMRNAGSMTVAQDQASCTVYGMPAVAMEMGSAIQQLTPEQITQLIIASHAPR